MERNRRKQEEQLNRRHAPMTNGLLIQQLIIGAELKLWPENAASRKGNRPVFAQPVAIRGYLHPFQAHSLCLQRIPCFVLS